MPGRTRGRRASKPPFKYVTLLNLDSVYYSMLTSACMVRSCIHSPERVSRGRCLPTQSQSPGTPPASTTLRWNLSGVEGRYAKLYESSSSPTSWRDLCTGGWRTQRTQRSGSWMPRRKSNFGRPSSSGSSSMSTYSNCGRTLWTNWSSCMFPVVLRQRVIRVCDINMRVHTNHPHSLLLIPLGWFEGHLYATRLVYFGRHSPSLPDCKGSSCQYICELVLS
ncbi:hypothetical protein C8T65DRAFT_651698 [Cerioporus squamosus]|nr:hypothetical protein C8T65DRAFT_651698 [Cerioporus squamosus]